MRRGFKKEANQVGLEIREELGIEVVSPFCPWKLAEHLCIPVLKLSSLNHEAPIAYRHFSYIEKKAFSAVTVFYGTERMIVHNDFHSNGRQASDLAHELAHAILMHPAMPQLNHFGCRDWDKELEEEADWLGGVLLVSEEAALEIVRQGLSEQKAANNYKVTKDMIRFRVNMTGARKRIRRKPP